jgi:hypothetical protein
MPRSFLWNRSDANEYSGVSAYAQKMKEAIMSAHDSLIAARTKQVRLANRQRKPAPFEKEDLVYISTKILKTALTGLAYPHSGDCMMSSMRRCCGFTPPMMIGCSQEESMYKSMILEERRMSGLLNKSGLIRAEGGMQFSKSDGKPAISPGYRTSTTNSFTLPS